MRTALREGQKVGQNCDKTAQCSEGEVRYFVTAFAIVDLRRGSSSFEGNNTSCYFLWYTNVKNERNQ